MTDDVLILLHKGLPGRSQEREVILREANRLPFQGAWEPFLHLVSKSRVRIDTDAFPAKVRHGAFCRATTAFRLDVAMIRSQIDLVAPIQK
jgi:hypothetical protein